MPLRYYQTRALQEASAMWRAGTRSVCLVSPTGSGKTTMGATVVERARSRVLWVAHRAEPVAQAADRLRSSLGHLDVGVIAPGHNAQPRARVQVGTVQTLLARGEAPSAGLVVLDEAHHYQADSWRELLDRYPGAYTLGLTATPERSDGRPLGDVFSGLVVAASYSELLREGHLVPCRVFQPPDALGSRTVAQDPVAAYERFARGQLTFVFSPTVAVAEDHAAAFTAEGYPAAVISDKTSKRDRAERLAAFARGDLRVLCNVYALTEGVDVPAASCVILARGCSHVGMYLQIVGRVLRPHPSKSEATLIDLTGASLAHGLPTEDRDFGLDGEGIKRASEAPVRVCIRCGATYEGGLTCPACEYRAESEAEKIKLTIANVELREVYAGAATPPQAMADELTRLIAVYRERGYSAGWVVREYRRLFGSAPDLARRLDREELRQEYARYRDHAREHGYKPGFAKMKFKEVFGIWPS